MIVIFVARLQIDPAKSAKIHEFMVNAGWITANKGDETMI